MKTTFSENDFRVSTRGANDNDTALINLAAHRKHKLDRFPSVDDLLERLTDNTVSVANVGYRTR